MIFSTKVSNRSWLHRKLCVCVCWSGPNILGTASHERARKIERSTVSRLWDQWWEKREGERGRDRGREVNSYFKTFQRLWYCCFPCATTPSLVRLCPNIPDSFHRSKTERERQRQKEKEREIVKKYTASQKLWSSTEGKLGYEIPKRELFCHFAHAPRDVNLSITDNRLWSLASASPTLGGTSATNRIRYY